MLVDMHLHECTYSSDSKISLEEIVTTARGRGLDAVCITDHDSMGLREYAAEYSDRTGFPIFVGIEFFSLQGDITAWGIEDYPGCRVCGHRDLSPDLNGNGEIEPEEWIKACPCFEVKAEWDG